MNFGRPLAARTQETLRHGRRPGQQGNHRHHHVSITKEIATMMRQQQQRQQQQQATIPLRHYVRRTVSTSSSSVFGRCSPAAPPMEAASMYGDGASVWETLGKMMTTSSIHQRNVRRAVRNSRMA